MGLRAIVTARAVASFFISATLASIENGRTERTDLWNIVSSAAAA
jgi:hypothetical protein